MWMDFITAFRPQTIKLWDRPTVLKLHELLMNKGIHIEFGRKTHKSRLIIDILYHEKYHSPMGYERIYETIEEPDVPKGKIGERKLE